MDSTQQAPEWSADVWFNHSGSLQLADLRGRVVALETFQMLCPGCVSHGLPQAQRIRETFPEDQVAVVGLHTVFEHHDAMQPHALEAFLHEYGVRFPVGVDRPGEGDTPETMARYRLRGTPSLLLFDRAGRLRAHHFGSVSDMRVGAEISAMLAEEMPASEPAIADSGQTNDSITNPSSCSESACELNPTAKE